jgi:hypothetical protein
MLLQAAVLSLYRLDRLHPQIVRELAGRSRQQIGSRSLFP